MALKSLFKQTFIYGLATVLPRMLSFLLVPLYTSEKVLGSPAEYGTVSLIFSYFVLFNVILAYGMETAFFRFYNKEKDQDTIVGTSSISLIVSSFIFLVISYLSIDQISQITVIEPRYLKLVIWILFLDALVIIPFAWLRAQTKATTYTIIKLSNVAINLGLNLFFLLVLPELSKSSNFWDSLYIEGYQISYILWANIIASGLTLVMVSPTYIRLKWSFNRQLWMRMMRYAYPVLIAGIAFSINETFDRILLKGLLPSDVADTQIGMYSACYKLALFMTLFATAFRLGVEPFFFSHANTKNPQTNYARILEFFVAIGSCILLVVVVFADVLKVLIIRSEAYWEAMWIVPIVLMANFFLGIYHNLSVWYKITDRTKYGAIISVIGALVTLGINLVFIPQFGFKASAVATLMAYSLMAFISYFLGRHYYPIPYNLKKIGTYLALSTGLAWISFYQLSGNYYFGILAIVVFLLTIYISEKQNIESILKR
ncbi:lipopolysaccharide biosynthesis protein [Winogradskyella aurantiaca]|uniref:lipopolysaccharide biosynthesis protein n=1 Tax=Winogradskyella aurantiaca TaxID=2219558 RepID=UPI000E1C5D61|nr:oligosaccharide flippase family protein [Winogradskyella aurantiaca]